MAQQDDGVVLVKEPRVHDDAFQRTADPTFCYLDPARRHASARFLSKLYEGDGLYTLTGQPGIGKTTLLRHLAEQLIVLEGVLLLCPIDVLACRTGTTLADVLGACEATLGLGRWGAASSLKAAKRLQQLVESNRSPVLLVDDADLLGDDVLEALVTLAGLQAAERRFLSLVLAGHPSISSRTITGNDVLGASRAIELEPMAEPDVARLIHHRLRAAGRPEDAISPDAIAQIARHSAGVPGTVVGVCRRAMQIAENRSRTSVTADIVAEAIGEEISGVQRGSSRPELVASAPTSTIVTGPSPRPAASQVSIAARVPSPDGESRPVPPPTPRDSAPAPKQSLVREPHLSIPEVTLGRLSQWKRLLGRGRRLKLMLVLAGVFPVVLMAGLAVLSGNGAPRVGTTGASRAYDSSTAAMAPPDRGAAPATTPTPLPSPTLDATEGATGAPLAEAIAALEENVAAYRAELAAIEENLADRRAQQWSRLASVSPPAAVSESANDIALPGRVAPATTPTPLPSPTRDATEGAPGTPSAETAPRLEEDLAAYRAALAARLEKPSRPASPTAGSASASMAPPAALSESASDKVARVQLAARMQGLEPGPPIDLPVRLSKGQSRTIYCFTELRGLSGRTVLHRWEWNGRIMQERQLHPASQLWRAYTAMTIAGDMRGSWRVSTVDATTGKVLVGQRFEVE